MITYDLNLYPGRSKSITDQLLFFALHYFRYIVVLTQIVVIAVFFYRLTIDQQIIDQKEAFKSKQQILALMIPLLEEAEATEISTLQVKSLLDTQQSFSDKYDTIFNTVPEGMTITELSFERYVITIKGIANDAISVRRYYQKLQGFPKFSEVHVKELNLNADFKFVYTIELTTAVEAAVEPTPDQVQEPTP